MPADGEFCRSDARKGWHRGGKGMRRWWYRVGKRGSESGRAGAGGEGRKKISFARYHCVCPVGRDRDAGFINTTVFGGIIA